MLARASAREREIAVRLALGHRVQITAATISRELLLQRGSAFGLALAVD